MIKFNIKYFVIFIILFVSEVLIAKYATGFLRHTFGDYLSVMLLYTFIKSFIKISALKAGFIVLLIAYIIEFLQLTNLENLYPLKYRSILKLILGTSFSIPDLVAYTLGVATILIFEKL
ncbi:DUF2809 domain-containing protein [Polaribacter sp. Asnod6-C07]|uniref:ribosomal maturation YjgA family protein n=1 Tax=Polaribacter sp. Asnod6-C07 TaxID=3160582 RepID=UPI00386985E2